MSDFERTPAIYEELSSVDPTDFVATGALDALAMHVTRREQAVRMISEGSASITDDTLAATQLIKNEVAHGYN